MPFTFGGAPSGEGNTNNPPAPAPAGGFAFGAHPAPAPQSVPLFGSVPSSAGASAAPGVPTFAGAAAPASGGGSQTAAPPMFGGSAPPPSSAPATGAYPSNPAPATGPAPFGAAPSGLSFGVGTGAPPTAAVTPPPDAGAGFSFGGGNTAAPASSTSLTAPSAVPQVAAMIAPPFDETFENLGLWTNIRKWCASLEEAPLAGQELSQYVIRNANTRLLHVKAVEWAAPNSSLRQQLLQNPVVSIEYEGLETRTTTLNRITLHQVIMLASDLKISEARALSLYAQVSQSEEEIQNILSQNDDGRVMDRSVLDQFQTPPLYTSTTKLASQFYFYERHLKLQSILYLLQYRIKDDPDVIRATDSLFREGMLIENLMVLIKDCNHRIGTLQTDIAHHSANASSDVTPSAITAPAHLMFCQQERQMAAEALVFIAYHTQLGENEVTRLVDLIHEMSNMAAKPSPLKDVPSPMEDGPSSLSWSHTTSHQFSMPEKDRFVWQEELVRHFLQTRQIELMECLTLLVVAAVAAMDTKQVLHNRDSNGPNSFGKGNMLLPPGHPSADNIQELNKRLKQDARSSWNRQDIWGILACSFTLLLRSTPTAIASPRGSSTQLPREVRETARTGLEAPAEAKSFTFCRLTMIPYLQKITSAAIYSDCDLSEFGLAVVAEFFAAYLNELGEDGSLPGSRQRWQSEEEEDLKLRRDEQDSQRRFENWTGDASRTSQQLIPSSVNFMDRPDCLDDLIALATAICSIGWNFAQTFWARHEETGSLIPSQSLQECMSYAAEDDSLAPSVLSWMASLAVDEKSAAVIFSLLKPSLGTSESSFVYRYRWEALMHTLRWYAEQLSPDETNATISKPTLISARSTDDTSYYYNVSDNHFSGTSSTGFSLHQDSKSTKSAQSSKKKRKRLSESNRFVISSHLAVIMNTSLRSAVARQGILKLTLPVMNGGVIAGEDDTLVVLYKLAMSALPSEVRGATLSTIASLIQPPSADHDTEARSFFEKQGRDAWDCLESSTLLPIQMLDRYFVATQGQGVLNRAIVSFPPASLELASQSGDAKPLLPRDPLYGIVYEMEHVEAMKGWYPATEGFLELLKALICAVGCPSNLSETVRPRPGCTPYVEYVLHFVLPRALGLNGKPKLPFRMLGDQSRLVAKALAVINAVLVRYPLPQSKDETGFLDLEAVTEMAIAPASKMDQKEAERDFANHMTSAISASPHFSHTDASLGVTNTQLTTNISVPTPKSPGFAVLAGVLSPSQGDLLRILCTVLTDLDGARGVMSKYGIQSKEVALSYALYGSTPPTFASVIAALDRRNGTYTDEQTFLKPFYPRLHLSYLDETSFDDSVNWREMCIQLSLNVLSAAAARQDAFIAAVSATLSQPLKIIPVLQFEQIKAGKGDLSSLDARLAVDVTASRLTDLLFSTTNSRTVRLAIVDYVGYEASTTSNDAGISGLALSLVYRLLQTSARNPKACALLGDQVASKTFVKALSKRLILSADRLQVATESEILRVILTWIVTDLRQGRVEDGIAHVLLGLSTSSHTLLPHSVSYPRFAGTVRDCLDAIVDIILHKSPVISSREGAMIASLCYETIFRLYDVLRVGDTKSMNMVAYTTTKLRKISFWERIAEKLVMWTTISVGADQQLEIFNCTAWFLKGLSSELRLLAGAQELSSVPPALLERNPSACASLLACLYGDDATNMQALLSCLPLDVVLPVATAPPREALLFGQVELGGALDVVANYKCVDEKRVLAWIAKNGTGDCNEAKKWSAEWNHSAARNCAIAHLADSISLTISMTVHCARSLAEVQPVLSGSSTDIFHWLESGGAHELMEYILNKFDIGNSSVGSQGMDYLDFGREKKIEQRNFGSERICRRTGVNQF